MIYGLSWESLPSGTTCRPTTCRPPRGMPFSDIGLRPGEVAHRDMLLKHIIGIAHPRDALACPHSSERGPVPSSWRAHALARDQLRKRHKRRRRVLHRATCARDRAGTGGGRGEREEDEKRKEEGERREGEEDEAYEGEGEIRNP